MKTLLITIAISITAFTAQAQLSNNKAQSYANEVFEVAQGYIEDYGEMEGTEYAKGFASEYMDFSMLRTMIGMVSSSNRNIEVLQSWVKREKSYQYSVAIDREVVIVVHYSPNNNGLIVGFVGIEK